MHRDDLRRKLALSNEKTEEEARWVEKMHWIHWLLKLDQLDPVCQIEGARYTGCTLSWMDLSKLDQSDHIGQVKLFAS